MFHRIGFYKKEMSDGNLDSALSGYIFSNILLLLFIAPLILFFIHKYIHPVSAFTQLIFCEFMNLVPILLFSAIRKKNLIGLLSFNAITGRSLFFTILFTLCIYPLAAFFNGLSMLFVENTIAVNSTHSELSPVMAFLGYALVTPVCEEIAFRGIIYCGFRKYCSLPVSVLIQAILFAAVHMNFNQASYTFVLGIFFSLILESSGSLICPILCHLLINSFGVISLYLSDMSDSMAKLNPSDSLVLVQLFTLFIISIIFLSLGLILLKKIYLLEHPSEVWSYPLLRLADVNARINTDSFPLTIPLLVALAISLFLGFS